MERLENLRESWKSILHASGVSHMTQPVGDLWCTLTTLQAYINHFGMTYVATQAQSIEISISSSAPATIPAPFWANWFEPNISVLSADFSSSISVLKEVMLVEEHCTDAALLALLSIRGYLTPSTVGIFRLNWKPLTSLT